MFQTIVLTTGIVANTALVVFGVNLYQARQSDIIQHKLNETSDQIQNMNEINRALDDNLLIMNVTLNKQQCELDMLKNNKDPECTSPK
jgi:hypothetical protein